jgi:NADH-quinone oxidoreductase subunit N
MGYALMGIVALNDGGMQAIVIYMFLYMIMTAGVFGILMSLRHAEMSVEELGDLAGLSKTHPFYAYIMAIMMFSMAGIPPLAGFFGKLVVFNAAVNAGFITLAVIGVVTSVVAAFYYLRVIKVMFFDDVNIEQDDVKDLNVMPIRMVLLASTIIICGFAFIPKTLFDMSAQIIQTSF